MNQDDSTDEPHYSPPSRSPMGQTMIGQKLGSFQIESELGSGAMGIVYLGTMGGKNRKAAIKVISIDQLGKGKALERFVREAKIIESLRHPNIVRYLARGKSQGIFYYAMEYITGPTLDQIIREQGSIPWREVVRVGIQLCDALHHAHESGVIHRDLKPSNLMLTESGQLKLTDFGIAKALDETALTGTGRTLGTATYMAPEQIRGTPEISHKTDLYALGAVFYQMLTGEPPFSGATAVVLMHAHINETPRRASDKTQEIPKALDNLVFNLMAKAPSDRPWDAAAVAQTLRQLQDRESKNETIKMVWAQPGDAASMPTRAVAVDPIAEKAASRPKKKGQEVDTRSLRERLEVGGLVAALLVIAGVIGYIVWPPSAAYYYRQAETLMASTDPLDKLRARDEYLLPLEQKHPKHPYREKVEAWHDELDLRDAERRAAIIEKPNMSGLTKATGEAEEAYIYAFEQAAAARKIRHDKDAVGFWQTMSEQLTREGRENRGWILLGRKKADALVKEMQQRRKTVADLLAKAAIPDGATSTEAAQRYTRSILKDIVARFDDYLDVADLVDQAKAALPPEDREPPKPSTPKP